MPPALAIREVGFELTRRQGAWVEVRHIDRHGVSHESFEPDLIECVAAQDLMRGRVDMRTNVVEQVVVGHCVSVLLHPRDRREGRLRQPREDRHPGVVGVREIHDLHRREQFDALGPNPP
jgi:hypothetical protein